MQIAILRYIHPWNQCNYSKGHRSALISRHNITHFWWVSVSGTPQPYPSFLKMGKRDGEARNTRATSAIAKSSQKCSCLGRKPMDVCSISSTRKCFLLVRFYRTNAFYRGSYFKRMQQLVDWEKENLSKSKFPTFVSRKTWLLHFIATPSAQFLVLYSEILFLVYSSVSLHCHRRLSWYQGPTLQDV